MDKRKLRDLHRRGAKRVQDLDPNQADLQSLAKRLTGKLGLDLSLLAPPDKAAVLRAMVLMSDDNAMMESYAAVDPQKQPEPPIEDPWRRPSRCELCGSPVVVLSGDEGTNQYQPYVDRLSICNEFAAETRRRAFQMMQTNPLLKSDVAWSRALDLELYKLAGEALDSRIDPF